jgi:zinc transport system substrate-binding protein
MHRSALLGTLCLAGLVAGLARADQPPRVVASVLPVGAIAAAVMDGVAEPTVLLEPGASPHAYSLRPSQAQALTEADLVLWVGPDLEGFLARPIEALGGDARQVALATVEGMALLPYREGPLFGGDAQDDEDGHAHDDHDQDDDHAHDADDGHGHAQGSIDGHVWLSPANARVMAEAIATVLGEVDPGRAQTYAANAAAFAASLDVLEAAIDTALAPVRGRPFVVFHDAYHYFERHFDMEAAGVIHASPEVQPGAARVAEIQARLATLDAACVFAEPQFEPRIVETVIEGSNAKSGVLDPLGGDLTLGPDTYAALLRGIAQGLADCLGD